MQSLFADRAKLPLVLMTIFAFSLSDTFDTIGTFIGTGRRTGIFSMEDEKSLEEGSGFSSKMDKALFADSIGTGFGAIFGTSNTTTYVESAAGIGAGGRTWSDCRYRCRTVHRQRVLRAIHRHRARSRYVSCIDHRRYLDDGFFRRNRLEDLEEAVPAFFASVFMGLSYKISGTGIAAGFIFFCIVKVVKGKSR